MAQTISTASSACTVTLFGSVRIHHKDHVSEITRARERALFVYLLLHPNLPHTREKLIELLWPEMASERSGRNFANVLYRLQQTIGAGWLTVEQTGLSLVATPDKWVDVWEFEQLCTAGDVPALEQAVQLYAGSNDATTETLAPEIYDDWIIPLRTLLHDKFLTTLHRLGKRAEQYQQFDTARDYFQRLLHCDPLNEEACAGLMRAHAQLGRVAEALAAYTSLAARLQEELGAAPGAQVQALAEMLRIRRDEPAPASAPQRVIPFIGRSEEKRQLVDCLDQAQAGRGGLVILLGEAGSGKTRLLAELSKIASRRGWHVIEARGKELTIPAPYAPLSEALVAALPRPRLQQLQGLIPSLWLNLLAGFAPALAEALGNPTAAGAQDAAALPMALQRVLNGICSLPVSPVRCSLNTATSTCVQCLTDSSISMGKSGRQIARLASRSR